MVDMRKIWKNQINLCKDIAEDIIKHNASKEICEYASGYVHLEHPYDEDSDYNGEFIRINRGESYCYLDMKNEEENVLVGTYYFNNDEMRMPDDACTDYEKSIAYLDSISEEKAYMDCEYSDCYDKYEGKEDKAVPVYVSYKEKEEINASNLSENLRDHTDDEFWAISNNIIKSQANSLNLEILASLRHANEKKFLTKSSKGDNQSERDSMDDIKKEDFDSYMQEERE